MRAAPGWLYAFLFGLFIPAAACSAAQSNALVPTPLSQAQWIAAQPDSAAPPLGPLPLFRDEFMVSKRISSAILYISGLGQFEAHVNGRNVTDTVLNPAWSDYHKRVFYCRYNVTALLRPGNNAIGVMLGNGMYNVPLTPGRYQKFHGSFGHPKLLLQFEIKYSDGTSQSVVSDGSWKTSPGPITFTSIYGGEDYDARLRQTGWDRAAFRAGWCPNPFRPFAPFNAMIR
jgi:alpha-L-rhamnosidase